MGADGGEVARASERPRLAPQRAGLLRPGFPACNSPVGERSPLCTTHEGDGPKPSVGRQPPLPSPGRQSLRLGCGALAETRPRRLTSCSDSGTSAGTMGRFTPRCSFSFSPPFSFPFSASPFSAWVIAAGAHREPPASEPRLDRQKAPPRRRSFPAGCPHSRWPPGSRSREFRETEEPTCPLGDRLGGWWGCVIKWTLLPSILL